jgi:transposase
MPSHYKGFEPKHNHTGYLTSKLKGMKQQEQNQPLFVGIDISKLTLDVSCLTSAGTHTYQRFHNTKTGFGQLNRWLSSLEGFNYATALFCLEHTGIYSRGLVNFLLFNEGKVWLESSLHLKRSMGLVRGKNDKIDSLRIARYAFANKDRAKLANPSTATLELLKDLLAGRKRLDKALHAIRVSVRELQKVDKAAGKELAKLNSPALQGLQKSKKALEERMKELIEGDEELARIFELVTSIKGVGPVLTTELLIYTHQFTRMNTPKQLACYCGVAPFTHTSGTSIRGKAGTSNFANMQLKSTLHLAAMSSSRYVPDLRQYFQRKVTEGKSKMCVLNAIRNKLLHRILAVVKRGTPYVPDIAEINLVKS